LARPRQPGRNTEARSFRQLKRFRHVINSDEVFGAQGFFYDDVIAKLHAQGRSTFDRQSFKDMCMSEKLLDNGRGAGPITVGVRSFMHAFDNLEARCDQTLNLVPHFEGRYVRDESDWAARIERELRNFITAAAQANDHLRLVVDAHVSLAFGVDALLDVKSGKIIEIEQRTGGRRFWSADDLPLDPAWRSSPSARRHSRPRAATSPLPSV
jgi:hypothetical protein